MSQILSKSITDIIAQKDLESIAANYKTKMLMTEKQPHLWKLFDSHKMSRKTYDLTVGIFGGAKNLHTYFSKEVELHQDKIETLLETTVMEMIGRIPDMSNKELITLMGSLEKFQPKSPEVANNINFDMSEYLGARLIDGK